jgi:predicted metal-dependent hydrolase
MENDTTFIAWPPAFTLKKSPRSRSVKIKASARHGLELIVPMRFNQKSIPEILESNKAWIEKQLIKIQVELNALDAQVLPTEIILPLLNQTWKIQYIPSNNKKLRLMTRPQQELVLFGNTEDKNLCKTLLGAWVRKQAKIGLPARLAELSLQTRLDYTSITIRSQRSRWGSCSTQKAINLNYKLLFLPVALVDHIIIHELSHTVHMNHSTKFWRLVASLDSQWKYHCHETRHANKYIPLWARET